MNKTVTRRAKSWDWTDVLLFISTVGLMTAGFIISFYYSGLGFVLLIFGLGISIGSFMMRQFMLRWIKQIGMAKFSKGSVEFRPIDTNDEKA